jgi:D-alanine-D-alanine ligase
LLFGGRSAEHEISLLSSHNIHQAIDRDRFQPFLVGIDRQGRWRRESDATLDRATGDPRGLALDDAAPVIDAGVLRPDDVVFPMLHGTGGEDGTIQGLLELCDVAYVGAGVLGSAIGMDKEVSKRLLRDAGIPVVDYRVLTARAHAADADGCLRLGAELGYPLFCKPANTGSSVGVSKVRRAEDLAAAVAEALSFDTKVLLERGIDAREIESAVLDGLGGAPPQASPPGEIVVSHKDGFYSYDAKYVDQDAAKLVIPAALPAALSARVQQLAVDTFLALELAGMARVDFFVDRGTLDLYVNEVNTLPGFTAGSMYPKMWEAAGLPIKALVSRLIDLAVERRDARRALLVKRTLS